jgi:hypothetical protein
VSKPIEGKGMRFETFGNAWIVDEDPGAASGLREQECWRRDRGIESWLNRNNFTVLCSRHPVVLNDINITVLKL